jgi:HupE / UreJ protein
MSRARGARWSPVRTADKAWLLALVGVLACWCGPAFAHKSSDSFLRLTVAGAQVRTQWDIALRDLDVVLNLDANGDGLLSWGEVRRRSLQLSDYALQRLSVHSAGKLCVPGTGEMLIDNHTDGAYAVLRFVADCGQPVRSIEVDYRLFADVDAGHRGLLNLTWGSATFTQVLGPDAPAASFGVDADAGGAWRQFAGYLRTGVKHIWSGFDHLLFLCSLLLPAVLLRQGPHWEARTELVSSLAEVVRVVTAFTVAHSLTLGLAAFGVLRVPARVSESAIALSVVVASLNNVWPVVKQRRWVVAFAFGLIHGLGFANVLSDLGLPVRVLARALVGFNLGVEAGQLAIVAMFLPVAYFMRETLFYRRYVVTAGSVSIALLGSLWLVERALNLRFLPIH